MSKKDIVILGTSGFAREILWLIEENNKVTNEWNILGFVDRVYGSDFESIHGYDIIGDDNWLLKYEHPIYAVCGIGNSALRKKIVGKFKDKDNIIFPNLVSKNALLSNTVQMGEGCIVCSGSILTVDIKLGDYVTINLDCTVGHDVTIRSFVTLYPSVNVSGNVYINSETEIGTGTNIIQGLNIGHKTVIGAGSVVVRDIPDNCTAVGNPAKVIKQR